MLDLILKNGTVVTLSEQFAADVGVADGKIALVGRLGDVPAREEMDVSGCFVMPGGLDVHTHMQLPFCGTVSADDFVTGTRAAACGGVTTLIDFAIPGAGVTPMEAVVRRREEADPKVCIDYGLHAAFTKWTDESPDQMRELVEYGIPTFKLFMVYRNEGWMADDFVLYDALRVAAERGGMVGVHAENVFLQEALTERLLKEGKIGCEYFPGSRPDFVEAEAIARAIRWAEASGGTLYIFHMSSGMGTDAVADGKRRGVHVYAETAMTYLQLNDELFKTPDGPLYATCPPIRRPVDNVRLWQGIADGDVQVIATDHCAFNREQKAMWEGNFSKIPFGMPGIETSLPVLFSEGVSTGRIDLPTFVKLTSANPARLFGLYPEKGSLQTGTDADIVVFDPEKVVTLTYENLHMNVDYCPFEGLAVRGYPIKTLLRGKVIYNGTDFVGQPGDGRFLKRGPVQPL
jgi:dihydropyrimidinase